jgi:hypothetical protein
MSATRILWIAAMLVAVALPPGKAQAQTTSASLTGTVRTDDSEPVDDAVIQARSAKSGAVRTTVSDAAGRYRLDLLGTGDWTVVARLANGQVSESRTVTLHLQETVQLDFTVGEGLAERVVVRAEPPLVDRRQTASQLRLTSAQSDTIPMAGRQFTNLSVLDSAVRSAAPGNFYGEREAIFIINGQSGRSNSFLVDGLDNNDQVSGTSLNSTFSAQVIDEFVLLKNQFAPEFGRATGGVLNIVTKQGTNELSWGGFVQGTDDAWNESGKFVDGLPEGDASQDAARGFSAGFNFGGPIRKDKAFYFVAYEHQESDNLIPFTGIDRDGIAGGRLIAPSDSNNVFARFDFNLAGNSSLMVRLSADDRTDEGVNIQGVLTPEAGFQIDEQDLQLAATLKSIISPDVINEVRFLASTSDFEQEANSDRPGVSRPSGIFGGNNLNRQLRDETVFQLVENVTWRRGRHTMKFGVDLLHSETDLSARFNPNGNFIYNEDTPFEPGDCGSLNPFLVEQARQNGTYPLVPCPGLAGIDDDQDGREGPGSSGYDCGDGVDNDGDGLADAADPGCQAGIDEPGNIESYPIVYALIDGEPDTVLEDTRIALFGQDRFELGSRWILNYGLRYELSTYELPTSAAVDSIIPNGGASRDSDNWAPRFGFTFSPKPDGKLIVRGGAGIFYDKLVLAFPATAAVTSGTAIQLAFPQPFALEITEDFIEANGTAAAEPAVIDELTLKFSSGTELETPHTVQYNLGVDRKLGKHGAVRADLVRVLGYDLPMMVDLNPVTCVPDLEDPLSNPDCIGLPGHPDTTIAAIVTEGRSWYDALDLNWRWQRDATWFRAGYTLSDAEDLGSDPLKDGVYVPPDSTNLRAEKGRSDGDRKHRLVVSGDFPLPVMGLRASAVVQYATGLPFNVTTGTDDDLNGIVSERPAGIGRNTGADTPLAAVNQLRVDAGLGPVRDLDEPDFHQVDVRVYKQFGFRDRKGHGQVFVQVFNLLNRENYGLIEGRAISGNFGRPITLAGPPRTVEVGLMFSH